MKNILKTGLALNLLMASQIAFGANVIDLQMNTTDLNKYLEKPLAYSFTNSKISVNGKAWIDIEEMETRGQSSINAKRRNFGIKLDEKVMIGGIEAKNLNVLSMWIDKGYVSSKFGLMIVDQLNIGAPLLTEYAELKINGKTNGLYLVVEKPKSAAGNTPYMVRRGYRSAFKSKEAKISKKITVQDVKKIEQVRDSIYAAVVSRSGAELYNELKQKMDIEGYMKWMVMNSLFRNGDGPDEVFFYVDADMYKAGSIYFRIMPWDFDDLFKPMHDVSINKAMLDKSPDSIIYNFEDKLDNKFAHDAYLYTQLKAMTRKLLTTELTQINTNAVLENIQKEISPYLERNDILDAGKVDGGRKGLGYSKKEILDIIANRKVEIEKRRTWLLQRSN